jgi:hypothetical protein
VWNVSLELDSVEPSPNILKFEKNVLKLEPKSLENEKTSFKLAPREPLKRKCKN